MTALPLNGLTAISPIDGRYRSKADALSAYFSEFALIRYRVTVEIRWLQRLAAMPQIAEAPPLGDAGTALLDAIAENFLPCRRRTREADRSHHQP
jgi:adenylosuccinate lyase